MLNIIWFFNWNLTEMSFWMKFCQRFKFWDNFSHSELLNLAKLNRWFYSLSQFRSLLCTLQQPNFYTIDKTTVSWFSISFLTVNHSDCYLIFLHITHLNTYIQWICNFTLYVVIVKIDIAITYCNFNGLRQITNNIWWWSPRQKC